MGSSWVILLSRLAFWSPATIRLPSDTVSLLVIPEIGALTVVRAPISGITSKETVSEGSLMVAGDQNASLLSNITQLDPIYVNFAAPDSDVESVRSGLQNGSLVLPEDGLMR